MALFDRLTNLIAVGVAVSSALPIAARAWWVFELFTHFRLQYVALLAIAMLVFIARRRWRASVAVLPFMIFSVWAILDSRATAPATAAQTAGITILNTNVNSANTAYDRLVSHIVAQSPDIAVLVEINDDWRRALRELESLYPYRVERTEESKFGIVLLSRLPLLDTAIRDLRGTPAALATVQIEGRPLRIVAAHFRPPESRRWSADRNAQLDELGRWIAGETTAVVAVGDFNITAFSPIFSDWLDEHGLIAAAQSRPLSVSWPAFLPLLGILIDHYVVTDELVIGDYSRGPPIGSDHYPLLATIRLRGRE
ncbi:MAG TPA: endonuclease/exonuclease/phosphatase family protein [Gammaproteobacteria bacterium]